MPREEHLLRQVQWKKRLEEYGCNVRLEKTIYINNAPVIIDVYAEVEENIFLIEIGDIADKRKTALLQLYTQQNQNVEFIQEKYTEDKIQQVLQSISAYRKSPEYYKIIQNKRLLEEKKRKRMQTKKKHFQIKAAVMCSLSLLFITWVFLEFDVMTGISWFVILGGCLMFILYNEYQRMLGYRNIGLLMWIKEDDDFES